MHLINATLSSPNFSLSSTKVFSPTSLLMSDRQTCHHDADDDSDSFDDDAAEDDVETDDGSSDGAIKIPRPCKGWC